MAEVDSAAASEPRRKRVRIAFTCTNCRQSKQRCDRQTPCASCIRRGKSGTCVYDESVSGANQGVRPFGSRSDPLADADLFQDSGPKSPTTVNRFGYSTGSDSNSVGIYKQLEQFGIGITPMSSAWNGQGQEARLDGLLMSKYTSLLSRLPSRFYVKFLTDIFFAEINGQYSLVEQHIFLDQVEEFFDSSSKRIFNGQGGLQKEQLSFPALLLQIAALALQLLPLDYNRALDDLCVGRSFQELSSDYADCAAKILLLLGKERTTLLSIQMALLRASWLKNDGQVVESWHALGQAVRDAQQIGLHQDGQSSAHMTERSAVQLWDLELRRRVMLNLVVWDSQMAVILGKPMHIRLEDCKIVLPLDAHCSANWKHVAPVARSPLEKPTSFTQRLVEYQLHIHLHKVRTLEMEGPFPQDYTRVEHLDGQAHAYMDSLPQIWRFDDPDTSFDAACPWLSPQREYLCSITWFFLVALHRPYIFTMAASRTEIVQAGIQVLHAQDRLVKALRPHQYKLFILFYLTFEAAVAILAVYIAFPTENSHLSAEAFHCIEESIAYLQKIRGANVFAGPGVDVVQTLYNRARPSGHERGGHSEVRPEHSQPSTVQGPMQPAMAASTRQPADWVLQAGHWPPAGESANIFGSETADMTSFGRPIEPLQPTHDLMYHDLSTSPEFDPETHPVPEWSDYGIPQSQQQFLGDFGDNTFWELMNQSM